ncbi:MAG: 2-oxoglutarate oxidoreductase [Deltaproteobacteria bacterium]|nr:2-oxoglutarate oxidoreductase [Deltaproteobacteria bacterium]
MDANDTAVFTYPRSLSRTPTHYCPGCLHGVAHRLVAEAIDALGVREKTVGICPVGCSVLAYKYFDCDMIEASHGRAPAVATGVKRARPDLVCFTYQGDGDLASIGMAEIIHAANRNEPITVIFYNNAIYGMTGGQMAPTTLVGMKTSTSPTGRDPIDRGAGYPIRMVELLNTLEGPVYLARQSLLSSADIFRARRVVQRAFSLQSKGFTFVEFVGTCPTNWGMAPVEAREWAQKRMIEVFPIGVFRDREAEAAKASAAKEA